MSSKPPISISLGPAKPKPPALKPAPLTKKPSKRPASHLASDDEDASDDESTLHRGKVQLLSGLDSVFSDEDAEKKKPIVIPALKNRDWKKEAEAMRSRKKTYLPAEAVAAMESGKVDTMETDVVEQRFGLQIMSREASPGVEEKEEEGEKKEGEREEKPKTEDEIALEALISNDAKKSSNLILNPVESANDWRAAANSNPEISETDAYRRDLATRPDVPSLSDYAAVPVEEFGAALLRGMGWKEGQQIGKRKGAEGKLRVVDKRPAFLGIGAKPREEVPELGAWGKADKKKSRRHDTTYTPVVLVDKRTGKPVAPEAIEAAKKPEGDVERRDRDVVKQRDTSRNREKEKEHRSSSRREKERLGSYDSSDRRRRDRERSTDRDRDRDRRDRDRGDRWRDDKERRREDSRERRRRSSRERGYDKYERSDRRDRDRNGR
ncbi:DNA primase large subunit Spp2 [Rhizina undulata]